MEFIADTPGQPVLRYSNVKAEKRIPTSEGKTPSEKPKHRRGTILKWLFRK
jgi:hypothetical protein